MIAWIGVDLDGTLAEYDEWKGPSHIGKPVPSMVFRVRKWLVDGKQVKIFTARATDKAQIPIIEEWCLEHIGVILPITCCKDYAMIECWDDRAVQIVPNMGTRVDGKRG